MNSIINHCYDVFLDCKYFIFCYHPIFVAVTVSKITNDVNWQRYDDYNDWLSSAPDNSIVNVVFGNYFYGLYDPQFTQRKQKIYPFLDEEILSVTPYSHFHEIKSHMRSLQKNILN